MRRADRLFQIVQLLRRRRVLTARELAAEMEVSERTIYRDVRDLSRSGVPIEGEAGIGYLLRDYDLPPLMFSREEVEALVLGARIVESWTDEQLARSARSALAKLEDSLPSRLSGSVAGTALYAPREHQTVPIEIDFAALRCAIRERSKIRFSYSDVKGSRTRRSAWPLGLAFYGPVWVLAAWCELRSAFRTFRPDRMLELAVLDERFEQEEGRTMEDYVAAMMVRL
jgi:predicted DNA-binding transcriptional regulator YafY